MRQTENVSSKVKVAVVVTHPSTLPTTPMRRRRDGSRCRRRRSIWIIAVAKSFIPAGRLIEWDRYYDFLLTKKLAPTSSRRHSLLFDNGPSGRINFHFFSGDCNMKSVTHTHTNTVNANQTPSIISTRKQVTLLGEALSPSNLIKHQQKKIEFAFALEQL